jgi:hypothetical protein
MSTTTAATTHATTTASAHAAATSPAREGSATAPGCSKTRIPMVALGPRRSALPNAAESATVLCGFARRNPPITHSLASGLSGTSGLRLCGRSASLQILPHVASITVGQGSV